MKYALGGIASMVGARIGARMKIRFIAALVGMGIVGAGNASDYTIQKLYGHWAKTPTNYKLGGGSDIAHQLACSEKWILAGAPASSEGTTAQGAVQVFNTVTGAWVRKLLPPGTATPNTQFGSAVAVAGDLGLVVSEATKIHVFNLSTGALVRTMSLPAVANASISSIAVSGARVIVGATVISNHGFVAFFDLNTGAFITSRSASDAVNNDSFGFAVAAEGGLCVVTAPYRDGNRGAAYLFDLASFTQIKRYQPTGTAINDYFGQSVAMDGGKLMIGAPGTIDYFSPGAPIYPDGKVFFIDVLTGVESQPIAQGQFTGEFRGWSVAMSQGQYLIGSYSLFANNPIFPNVSYPADGELIPTDASIPTNQFGYAIAMSGNTAVASAPFDKTQASLAGAIYVFRNIQTNAPLIKFIAKGDSAPGAVDINFNTLGDFYMTDFGVALTSSLSGAGSNNSKDSGFWGSLNGFRLARKTRDLDGAATITSISKLTSNNTLAALYQSTLSGPGITSSNNQAIYRHDGSSNALAFRTGTPLSALTNAQPLSFTQLAQTRVANRAAVTCTLKQGIASTSATNDSALLLQDFGTQTMEAMREGASAASSGYSYGQFTGRVAAASQNVVYPAAITATLFKGQALFQKLAGDPEAMIVRTSTPAPQATGFVFTGFLGETTDQGNGVLARASVTTTTAPIFTSEGLWGFGTNGLTPVRVLMKGDSFQSSLTVRISKIINYWQTPAGTLTLVQLTGSSVSSKNDQALLLISLDGSTTQVLMREGDAAPGCDPATIGTITRIEVEPFFGEYLVLATLVGAPTGTDLALFRGLPSYPTTSSAESVYRLPIRVLRKGQLFSNQPGKVKSISLPSNNITTGGAGCTGIGSAIGPPPNGTTPGVSSVIVEFDNGVRQIMMGRL